MLFFYHGTLDTQPAPILSSNQNRMYISWLKPLSWIFKGDINPQIHIRESNKARPSVKRLISSTPPLAPSVSQYYAETASPVSSTAPVDAHHYTKVKLVTPAESRPAKIRRVGLDIASTPLPPPPPRDSPSVSNSSCSSSAPSCYSVQGDTSDDGLDDLALFLRQISYETILASTIHQHLGYVEDGGKLLPLTGTVPYVQRRLSPSRRFSSLMGVSVAIMEGRLPKALVLWCPFPTDRNHAVLPLSNSSCTFLLHNTVKVYPNSFLVCYIFTFFLFYVLNSNYVHKRKSSRNERNTWARDAIFENYSS